MAAGRIDVIKNHLSGVLRVTANRTSAFSYQYTLDNNNLSKFQRDFYEENGYILISKLIPDDIIEKCRQRFVDLCDGKVEKGVMILMKEILMINKGATGEFLYNKAQDLYYDDMFALYTEFPALLDYVQSFTGPNIMGMHSMLINKPPGSSIHPPHQDLHYFSFRPIDRIVASWTAMEPVFMENGCLYVVPGTHKAHLYEHTYPMGKNNKINKAYHGIQNQDEVAPEAKRVYLPMEKGDTVFFHPLLVHGSGPNLTKSFRKAISCHYAGSEGHYIDIKGTIQENVEKEIQQIAKRRGFDIDFEMFWRMRSKLVRGKRIHL